jgi:hypothetical protein
MSKPPSKRTIFSNFSGMTDMLGYSSEFSKGAQVEAVGQA